VPASVTSTEAWCAAGAPAALVAAVQRNCDFADAHHAREKSLCTYLLGMREYFRWDQRLPLGEAPPRAALAGWIAERESRWERLREAAAGFAPLPLAGGVDPFDEAAANRHLAAAGLVYGAGVGLFGAPLFFLAVRVSQRKRDGAQVLVAGAELARGFVAPPAASRGTMVTIRLDALRRWLWSRAEAARRGPPDGAFAAALRAYGDPDDAAATVERMAHGEVETLVLHELGELRAGALLGAEWEEMLAGIDDRRTELRVRAVRDLLADCLVTLPTLIERDAGASLLFWLAGFDGLQRVLAPELAAPWRAADRRLDHDALARAALRGREVWLDTARELVASWRAGGQAALAAQAAFLAPAH
jgi:hypothetical protein